MSLTAIRNRKTGDVEHVSDPDDYPVDQFEVIERGLSKPRLGNSAADKRHRKIQTMSSVERYDALLSEIDGLRARLDKAGL